MGILIIGNKVEAYTFISYFFFRRGVLAGKLKESVIQKTWNSRFLMKKLMMQMLLEETPLQITLNLNNRSVHIYGLQTEE